MPHPDQPPAAEPPTPLGPRQHAVWMLQQLAPESAVANLSIALRSSQTLRWWPLEAAINHLATRHPALRTRFPVAAGVPVRHVTAPTDLRLTVDVEAATEDDLTDRLDAAAARPFDLATDLPVRLVLVQLAEGGSVLLLVVHHIAADAASVARLVGELARAYDAFAAGDSLPADMAGEILAVADAAPRAEDVAFWREHLRGHDAAAAVLPTARPSPALPTFAGETLIDTPAPPTMAAVGALRKALGTTENLVLLTAFYLTLFRHGAGTDLVVGVPVTVGRDRQAKGVGFRASTMPLRVVIDPDEGFAALARRVREAFLAGAQHASASTEDLLAEIGHRSGDWRVPLFRYMYNYRPWHDTNVSLGGEPLRAVPLLRTATQLDIQLVVIGGGQTPETITTYGTDVHDRAEIAALLERMAALIRRASADPHRPIRELAMTTDAEERLLAAANDTLRPGFGDTSVARRFIGHAERDPAATALIEDGREYSYGELRAAAGRISGRLREAGVGPGDTVGVALPRGFTMAAAMLGVWGAGACYLPMAVGQPEARMVAQLTDAGVRVLITESDADRPGGIAVLTETDLTAGDPIEPTLSGLDDSAYVIYTSGSTGQPRGVVVTHRNLANVVADFADRLGVTGADPVLWSTTTAFDISALEVFLPLSLGGSVVAAGRTTQTRPRDLLDLVARHDVVVVQATPTFWRLAVAEVTGDELRGRTVLCGGEPMSAELARDLVATGCRLLNVYGPTETTIWSTAAEVDARVTGTVPIGRPIANTHVFVADQHGASLAPGLLGELCIGGTGVSAGYLGRPELTAQRFPGAGADRYYRTGDLARWRADGTLELFGRNDRQVKLRGHRIELPEIEAVLQAHDEVAEAAVVIVGDPQAGAELRAFVTAAGLTSADGLPERIWPHLRDILPAYSLPSRITVLPELPVSPNGKRDLAALAAMEVTGPATAAAADRGPDRRPELTAKLVTLWRDILGRPALGEHDHFFLHGGHSLLAVRLAARAAEIAGTDVAVRLVFDHPTPRQLSARLAEESRP
ncbi:amino acid adenylation domain-containing protein [Micromonospora sp. NPDC126480]|uniref:non-ribosomal peptide synthetase n=1 Tax=Micromonospora sp. NPDC126480 TaxID=3155312 RepID=UPI00332D4362